MLETIKEIIHQNDLAVLATSHEDRPHCSLMAYVPDSDCTRIYLLTLKDSRKFANISRNPYVSLLVDTRDPHEPRKDYKALTISGTCAPADTTEQEKLRQDMVKQHPQLKELADKPDCVLLVVNINSFLLLDGVSTAHYIELDDQTAR
ncbi:pyridoxamine 5'-phosphate oxidase-related FMN-binding protein [Desulfonatronospira thiodismutans ASO3-1]|uniref:Pyridoxamine 5'-phosphate oxidase-related FMN-binding protein n=1 Tax=Desulfonatronospira thiodismutans ASO3-1 TaxID=555779 RepID=D6SLX3_9BACT|nr:pyridoxamine 5'-phosphate oxidase family protein [Desulfonatronospira thiodismutans]EFI35684.1 pyridoxamine 5'-phosphate oxidase-related FMN-binding protein [Desulfonatronospira thiodismutans ASO3-1]